MKGSSLTELDEIRIDPARHHRGKHEPGPAAGYVQIYVKSSCSVGPVVRPNWRLLPAAPL